LETQNGSKNGDSAVGRRYVFDDFAVDPANRTCTRGGRTLPVTGKAYDILLVFVENPGRLLSKEELLARIWPDEFVEEGNLARNVSTLRKVLCDAGKQHKYIATVPGHGYKFVGDVSQIDNGPTETPAAPIQIAKTSEVAGSPTRNFIRQRAVFWISAALILFLTAAWFGKDRLFPISPIVKSLAVLPLRGIDPNDNYLGVGIADSVIRRISNSGQVTVRPTSAVLHYMNQDIDTLAAARELNADAILEGNVQRFGDNLRVSVNLLRTSDGGSIWSENFDLRADDIFSVQDEVAERVADKLKIRLGSASPSTAGKYPVDQRAYEFYLKGLFSLDQRGFNRDDLPNMLNTIDLFQQSVAVDPNYAMAHGQLAFSYAWMAMFIQPDEPKWVELARQEIALSEKLDPNVAEAHVASGLLYWSSYGGYQNEAAIKEFRLAKRLNPGYSGAELIALYGHVGLEQQAAKELSRGLTIDPTSQALHGLVGILPYLRGDLDAWFSVNPGRNLEDRPLSPWYLLRKGSLERAQEILDKRLSESPDRSDFMMQRSLLLALQGKSSQAENLAASTMSVAQHGKENYHHLTYFAACVFALAGKSSDAVKWLRETADSGFPNYPLFARDPYLDRIRQSPEFTQFLSEQKSQWDRFNQEFAEP
jgi:DNA-binding winged helix-turn-helix (wHTH) protein/TolB-like protein